MRNIIHVLHFLCFFRICKRMQWDREGGSRKSGTIPRDAYYHRNWKYWSHREQKLATRQPCRFHRPSHCILFLFCANNRLALSFRRRFFPLSAGGRVDVIRHCSRCFCSRVRTLTRSYPVAQSSFSCVSAAIEPLIKEPRTKGFLLARDKCYNATERCYQSVWIAAQICNDNLVSCCANMYCF